MPRLAAPWSLAALLLCGCAETPPPSAPPRPPPSPADAPCAESLASPDRVIEQLVATVADGAAAPAQRAGAVHRLGCMVGLKKRPDPGPIAAVLTLGISEIISANMAELVVSKDSLPPIVKTLGQAFCDASPEVAAVAERELRTMRAPVTGLALERAARSCEGPRAVAAVEVLEQRIVAFIAQQRDEGDKRDRLWSDLVALAPPLTAVAENAQDAARARAQEALAKAGAALDPLVLARAGSPDPQTIASTIRDLLPFPLFGPALERAKPAFQARLADPDYRVRLAAARILWGLEGAGDASLDRLAKDLFAGLRVPETVDPAAGDKLQKMLEQVDTQPGLWSVDLEAELFHLALAGPSAAPAVGAIRACVAIPEKKLRAIGAHRTAVVALAFVGRDRATLPMLRKQYDDFFADVYSRHLDAEAILSLEPDDPKARRTLDIQPGVPLLFVAAQRAIKGEPLEWWIRILLLREQDTPPEAAPRRGLRG